ncbi:MAG: phrB, partial [Paucimonas sp.]|nr:phrB [Paucimonas sp.]
MHLYDRALVWFRRDLRLYDHAALHAALHQSRAVFCIFVFDSTILQKLPRKDRRVEFIFNSLRELNEELEARGSSLILVHGDPVEEIPKAARELSVDAVFANRDYEPSAEMRDSAVGQELQGMGCRFFGFKDQAIFDADEVMTQDGRPFSVFTPYKNAWLKKLSALEASGNDPLSPYTYEEKFSAL